ncbi:MAG: sensor histidine kinase, partial [Pseudomonadaceae bacterium]|nr:sensor histidine kinase [Pseudomonadaceae bacterium]
TDQGKGVAPEMVNQLFERYQHKALQASQISSTVKSYGLGLFVAHEIVKAHAGSLKLVKNSSQGCTFQLELLL